MRIFMRINPHLISLMCLCLLVLAPLNSSGKLFVETGTATGIVADVTNNVITLDSGDKYYPAGDDMDVDLEVGAPVTLRFFTDGGQKNRFTAVAVGRNSLPEYATPGEKESGFK